MKKMNRILALSFVLAAGLALTVSGTALAATIAQWNYNATGNISGPGTQGLDAYGSGTDPKVTSGNITVASHEGYRIYYAEMNNQESGVTWTINTTNYTGISLSLDLYRAVAADTPQYYRLYTSTDGGTTWTPNGTPQNSTGRITVSTTSGWVTVPTIDISSIWGAANGNASFMLGFFEDGQPGTSTTNAYTTIDNVTFSGTAVPIPAAAWLLGSGLVGLVAIKRRMKK
jgi:hypothetical protein